MHPARKAHLLPDVLLTELTTRMSPVTMHELPSPLTTRLGEDAGEPAAGSG
ncbi:hypothetical protein BQ8420_11190 [Nocardiopsis sp. JB363]|nr:hypothetical protein BQ8420_11190 [Nocardiopsis sp. JB363]